MRALPTLVAITAFTLPSTHALADVAAAEALFQQGRELLDQGQIDAACEKFESSQTSEASSGTLLNLADCRLKQGRTATAWAQFVAAGRLAKVQNRPEHAAEAERRSAELEPSLSTLTLRVAEPAEGLEITLNGRAVNPGSYGTRLPMDPGVIAIEARAPQSDPFSTSVTLRGDAHQLVVDIPKLEQRSVAFVPAVPPSGDPERNAGDGSVGPLPFIVGGLGVAALGAGGVFGVMALSSNDEAVELCGGRTRSCPEAALEEERARDREALLSTVFVSVGVIGAGVATVLLFSSSDAPKPENSGSFLELDLGASAHGGFVSGRARF
jgi:hypothetical protein